MQVQPFTGMILRWAVKYWVPETITPPSINTNTTYYAELAYPGSNGSLLPAAPLTPMNIQFHWYSSLAG